MSDNHLSIDDYFNKISSSSSVSELNDIEQELFGRKTGVITIAMQELKSLSSEEKLQFAKKINTAKKELQQIIAKKHTELTGSASESFMESDRLDVTLTLPQEAYGHLHLVPEFIAQVEEVFSRMGFDIAYGTEIESEECNFNALNIPEEHPARDGQDTFWLSCKDPKKRLLLRTQTSPVQIHYMQNHTPPFRMICPGKVYRKDSDATHSPMFHQFEGLMIGKDVSLANMKAVMISAMQELIGKETAFRFRTGFFPFVEPGLEVDVRWQGEDAKSREGKWLEIVGCGMVHPHVLKNVGIDPNEWQGFAFGFGIERMIMIKHQIPDLRAFFQGDLRFLQQF